MKRSTTTTITLSDFLIGRPMTATGFDALDGANHKTHRAAKIIRGDTAVTHLYWPAREGKGADVAEALRRLGIGSDLTQFRAQGTWQGLDAAGLLLWHRGESTEEAPAPKPRRGRKSAAEREAPATDPETAVLTEVAEAAASTILPPATDADLTEAGITLESLAAASARAAAEAPAPKPKPEPKPKHPAAEVGSPEWKALRDGIHRLYLKAAPLAAIEAAIAAKLAGVPWSALDVITRDPACRGLNKRVWRTWQTRPEHRWAPRPRKTEVPA